MAFKRKLRRRARKVIRRRSRIHRSMPRNMVLVKSTTNTNPSFSQTSAAAGTIAFANGVWLITSPAGVGVNEFQISTGFCLADLTNDASYVALYQLYKIKKVVVRIIPFFNYSAAVAGSGSYCGCILHSATDPNDSSTASIAQLQRYKDYKNVIISSQTRYVKRTIKPRVDMDAQTSGGSALVYNMKAGWLSTGSIDVDHNALKMNFELYSQATGITFPFKLELTYHILFKDPQ